jgi:toxin FitB
LTYLIDTNVLSELRKGPKTDPKVAAWAQTIDETDIFISVVTILEIERGILLGERRDKRQGALLRSWLINRVIPEFKDRILPVDTSIARHCAALQVPDPRPHLDALIAATARVHRLRLVTRNVADFRGTGAELMNPWE